MSLKSNIPEAVFLEAITLHQAGELEAAKLEYEKILEDSPDHFDCLHLLGVIFSQLGLPEQAITLISKAIKQSPDFAEAYSNRGNAWIALNDHVSAEADFLQALKFNPVLYEANIGLGDLRKKQKKFEEAVIFYQKAIQLKPEDFKAYESLVIVLNELGDFDAAEKAGLKSLHLNAENISSYINLTTTFVGLNKLFEGRECAKAILIKDPENTKALLNLGMIEFQSGLFDKAITIFEKILEIDPDHEKAQWNQSLSLLGVGDLNQGWPAFDVGLTLPEFRGQSMIPQNVAWQGESLQDKSILILPEQGLGDELMFLSCLPDVLAQVKHCTLACHHKIAGLFDAHYPNLSIIPVDSRDDPRLNQAFAESFDVVMMMGSLPSVYRKSIDDFPQKNTFLKTDLKKAHFWKEKLSHVSSNLKVGIAWRSRRSLKKRQHRFPELSSWREILSKENIDFILLQYEIEDDELEHLHQMAPGRIHHFSEIDFFNDLETTAALIEGLDLVISPTISTGYLSAALSKRTWFITRAPFWQMLGTNQFPWFPTAKVFSPKRYADWSSLWEKLNREVNNEW